MAENSCQVVALKSFMEYLDKELNEAIEKAAIKKAEKYTPFFSVRNILDEMDRQRKLLERQSNRWWRKNLNLDEENY